MILLNLLDPRVFWQTLVKVYRNYSNLRFFKKTMRELDKTAALKQAGMRLDMRGRAYFVLNLEPEILMMGEEALALEQSRVYEAISSKNKLFESAGLSELIEAKTTRIKDEDYYAYLIEIKYRPMSNFGNLVHVILWLAGAAFLIYFIAQGIIHRSEIAESLNGMLNSK